MSEQDDRDFDALKRTYARLPKHEPGAHVDATVRAAARARTSHRRLRVWSAALATAACIGLAVVLVPALLVEAPVPSLEQRQGDLVIQVAREEREASERHAVEETAALKARERAAMPMIAAPAPPPDRTPREDAVMAQRAAPDMSVDPAPVELAALHAELADADETAWRKRILALRADGREPLAAALLDEFRARFDRPASFTLDDLAQEDAQER